MNSRREKKEKLFQGYLNGCYGTVEDAIAEGNFESLKDVHFWKKAEDDEAHIPDYSDPVTVAYYQLRYACGYAFEYYCAYRLALEWLKQSGVTELSAVSFGCGSGLDRYSLELAIVDSNFGKNCYLDRKNGSAWEGDERRWIGIDIARWGKPEKVTSVGFPAHDNVIKVLKGGIVEYFKDFADNKKRCLRNILFFPRILCELDEDALEELTEAVSGTMFSHERVIACIANRSNTGEKELEASQKVLQAFESCGMTIGDRIPQAVIDSLALEGGSKLSVVDNAHGAPIYSITGADGSRDVSIQETGVRGFYLPDNIGAKLRENEEDMALAHEKCPDRTDTCLDSCAHAEVRSGRQLCPLSINPVRRISQMNLQIVMLEKA